MGVIDIGSHHMAEMERVFLNQQAQQAGFPQPATGIRETAKGTERTFQILSRENNGPKMMIFNKTFDLRGNFSAIPAHNQHLPNSPVKR